MNLSKEILSNNKFNLGYKIENNDVTNKTYYIWRNIQIAFYVDFIYHSESDNKFYDSLNKEIVTVDDAVRYGLPFKI